MNALGEGDRFQIGDRNRRLLERAKDLGHEVFQWPTMNNTHPWNKLGGQFRLDKPEWLRVVAGKPSLKHHVGGFTQQFANCIACEPFSNWLEKLILDTLATGYYRSWGMDGDFWGTAAYPYDDSCDLSGRLSRSSEAICSPGIQAIGPGVGSGIRICCVVWGHPL